MISKNRAMKKKRISKSTRKRVENKIQNEKNQKKKKRKVLVQQFARLTYDMYSVAENSFALLKYRELVHISHLYTFLF